MINIIQSVDAIPESVWFLESCVKYSHIAVSPRECPSSPVTFLCELAILTKDRNTLAT